MRRQPVSDSVEFFGKAGSRLRSPDLSEPGDDTGDGSPSSAGEVSPMVPSSGSGELRHPNSGVDSSDLAICSGSGDGNSDGQELWLGNSDWNGSDGNSALDS